MKKFIAALSIGASLLIASPAFAYQVQPGDTLYKIARTNNETLAQLESENPQIKNFNLIYVGQTINTVNEKAVIPVTANTPDTDLLARLVHSEAQGESYEGKVAVADVVMNRVRSGQFPITIRDVIYQSGQFQPIENGAINTPADADSIKAANEVLSGAADVTGGALYFYNPAKASSSFLAALPTTIAIGNHVFKL